MRLDQDLLTRVSALARVGRLRGRSALAAVLVLAAAARDSQRGPPLLRGASRRGGHPATCSGAPLAAIRGPFVVEGALQALLGATIALVLLMLAHAVVVRRYGAELGGIALQSLSVWTMLFLLGGAILLGAWAGFAAVRRERGGQVVP